MKQLLEGVERVEQCRNEFFDTIEEELLPEYKDKGHRVRRWKESRGSRRGAGTGSGSIYTRHYLLVTPEQGPGFQFALLEENRRSGAKHSHTWELQVEPGSEKAVGLYRSLRYVLPLAGAGIGYLAFTRFAKDDNWPWWMLVGGFAGFLIYAILMRLFWRAYGKLSAGHTPELLADMQQQADDIMQRVIKHWQEQDVIYSQERMETAGFEELDLNDPEALAILTKEQAQDMEGTLRKYGIPTSGPRRDQYDAAMRRLRDDKAFYQLYLDAYNKLEGKG